MGDFLVHIGGTHFEILAFGQQIADLFEEFLVLLKVDLGALLLHVKDVDHFLHLVALGEQHLVARHQVRQDVLHLRPEMIRLHTGAGSDLVGYQVMEFGGNLKATFFDSIGHVLLPFRSRVRRERAGAAGGHPAGHRAVRILAETAARIMWHARLAGHR